MTKLDIDIWSDVMCPWCAVGYANLATALDQLEDEVEATIRWLPFELDPTTPPEGTPKMERLEKVYGRSPEEAEAMMQRMEQAAQDAGFPIAYEGGEDPPPPSMMWNTFEAHKLLRWTLVEVSAEAQTKLKLALFAAHFRQRRDISERDVLLDVAQAQGLDRDAAARALADEALGDAVRAEENRARANGITAVPTFVIAGKYMLQGSAQPAEFAQALRQVISLEAAT